jgi:hypothetical protein
MADTETYNKERIEQERKHREQFNADFAIYMERMEEHRKHKKWGVDICDREE